MRFRTLVRIVRIYDQEGILVVVPGWDPIPEVRIPWKDRPPFAIQIGDRLHAQANLGANTPDQLELRDWEQE